jgi:hypothetical protein
MKATTIKVEGDLLRDLERAKPPAQSVSGFVRAILRQDLARRKMAEAAERYAGFLQETPAERAWLEEWDAADLARPPGKRRRR